MCVQEREKTGKKKKKEKKMLGPVVNPDTSTHTWISFQTLVFPYHNRCQLLWCRTSRRQNKVSLLCVLKLSVDATLCCATSKRGDTASPAALWTNYLQISCPRHFPLLVLHSHTGLRCRRAPVGCAKRASVLQLIDHTASLLLLRRVMTCPSKLCMERREKRLGM